MENYKPDGTHIFVDEWSGRFRVSYPGEKPRSVSWTGRGMQAASVECLRILWGFHTARTGQQPVVPMDMLAAP